MNKIPLVVVAGATASGKTSLAINIAKKFSGEVVSADSMQIYKYMDIGTAKPTKEEMDGVVHHMIDIVTPDVNFSVADYCDMAHKVIEDIINRGKLPILAGGTGLYINSLVNDVTFEEAECDVTLRDELSKLAEKEGAVTLHNILKECDPVSAEKIHANNVKRVIRAIEVFRTTGERLSDHNEKSKEITSRYSPVMMEILWERDVLYERINKRVDIMMDQGLLEETKKLYDMGYTKDLTSMQGIGYKEMFEYFDGVWTLDEAVDKIKQYSRNYAKRQNTWFKRDERIVRLNPEESFCDKAFELVGEIIK